MERTKPTWYEFFAGGGMARLGLGDRWRCAFSNEWSEKKAAAYRTRFGPSGLHVCDVANLTPEDLPGTPSLVWGSFPCQDLSLAGNGAGLLGSRSGTFKPFWKLIGELVRQDRCPQLIVLENVVGTLTSHDAKDFAEIVVSLAGEGYRVGALVIDAVRFLPQSRPRLFLIGAHRDSIIPANLLLRAPSDPWHSTALRAAVARLPRSLQETWLWWNLPTPVEAIPALSQMIEDAPTGVEWHSKAETERLIGLMSSLHLKKLRQAQLARKRIIGTLYKRSRPVNGGTNEQRAEVRFDQIAGCLRTPTGGSSRQTIVVVDGSRVRSRLLSPREAARLMGVPDDYALPRNYNDAYHLLGDGLAVPVVRWLGAHLLTPLVLAGRAKKAA